MTTHALLISVIVPAYNAELYLEEAIQSIYRQQYEPIEIIIIDDGSTDRTADIAKSFGNDVIYIYQENKGPADARNRGIRMAKGELIAFLDADDIWSDNKLETQLSYFSKDPLIEIVMGYIQCLLASEANPGERIFKIFSQPFFTFSLPSGLFKKCVFNKVGYLDTKLRQSEDMDWFMRVRELGVPMEIIKSVTLFYRIHEGNTIRDRSERNAFLLRALKTSLDRRRLSGKGDSNIVESFTFIEKD